VAVDTQRTMHNNSRSLRRSANAHPVESGPLKSNALVLMLIGMLLCACEGRPRQHENHMRSQPDQKITSLTVADQQRLQDQRAVVENFLADDDSRQKYKTAAGKLGTIRAILQGNAFKPNQTYELQCLGIVLGDAFVQELKMEWVMVEDDHGRDPAVRLPGTSIILFPLTMISKRVERGEKVDVFDLFSRAAEEVKKMQRQGM
jgi:Domain of unknown function (DUF3806)